MEVDTDDNTAVIQMKGTLSDFIQPTPGDLRSRLNFSGVSELSSMESSKLPSVTVQQLLEKEKKDKERHRELIKSKTIITELQGKIKDLETSRRKASVEHEQQLGNMKCEFQRELDSVEKMKDHLNLLLKKEEDARNEASESRAELLSVQSTYKRKIIDLQKAKTKLELDLQEVEQKSNSEKAELRNNMIRKDSELQICRIELDEMKQQLHNMRSKYTEVKQQLQESEESFERGLAAEQRVKELENQMSRMESDAVIARTMKDQLDKLGALEKENRTLSSENTYWKETQENTFLLREEMESIKAKLERAEERCRGYNQLQLEHSDMAKRLQQWDSLRDDNNRPLSPAELKRQLSDLQTSNASLLQHQGSLKSGSHHLEGNLAAKEEELKKTKEQLIHENTKSQQLETFARRLQKKLLLVSKERDSYKGILDSYENEMTVNLAAAGVNQLRELQKALQGWEQHVASLEKETQEHVQELATTRSRARVLENELLSCRQSAKRKRSLSESETPVVLQLREQVASLEKSLEEALLAKQKIDDELERQSLQGGYDKALTKVIHFSNNPVALGQKRRLEEMKEVQEENKRLKMRVEILEKEEGHAGNITQKIEEKIEEPASSKEIEEMANQVKSAELKNKRLMEVFKKKSHELREAVYQLLGFTIHIPCDSQYRLMNMYAESPNDFLLFQQDSDGQFQMLATEYSSTLEEKIDAYLTNGNSIPAFLSSITTDLFSRQTVLQ